jgi:hypothetical protein
MAPTPAACYRLLGLPDDAPVEDVRRAYRRLARRYHPDVAGGGPASERFKEITAAYNVLIARRGAPEPSREAPRATRWRPADDAATWSAWRARTAGEPHAHAEGSGRPSWRRPATRRAATSGRAHHDEAAWRARAAGFAGANARPHRYAEEGAEAPAAEPARPQGEHAHPQGEHVRPQAEHAHPAEPHAEPQAHAAHRPGPRVPEAETATPDAATPRAERAPGLGRARDLFRRLRTFALPSVRPAGEDVTLRLPVDAETVARGGERHLGIVRLAACPNCARGGEPACVCGGLGRVRVREQVRVAVPPGAYAGARLRLAGKGTAGLAGHPDGDLYLVLEPAPLPGFRREGADLHGVVDVAPGLVERGGTLHVQLPGGTVPVSVPPGTRPGTRLRLRGQGLPRWGGGERGDVFLRIAVG